jgi:hypothetical protein
MANIAFTVQRVSDSYYLVGDGLSSFPDLQSIRFDDLDNIGIDGCYWIITDAASWSAQSSAISQVIDQLPANGPGGVYNWPHVLYRVYAVTNPNL